MRAITGTVPESQASDSSRSRRRRLGGSAIGWTTNTVSMLAASTWTSEVLAGLPAVMALVRSSTASISGASMASGCKRGDPVADRRQIHRTPNELQQTSGEGRPHNTGGRGDQRAAAVAADDPGRGQAPRRVRLEERLPPLIPSPTAQVPPAYPGAHYA